MFTIETSVLVAWSILEFLARPPKSVRARGRVFDAHQAFFWSRVRVVVGTDATSTTANLPRSVVDLACIAVAISPRLRCLRKSRIPNEHAVALDSITIQYQSTEKTIFLCASPIQEHALNVEHGVLGNSIEKRRTLGDRDRQKSVTSSINLRSICLTRCSPQAARTYVLHVLSKKSKVF